jgi:hypothetical protein
MGHKIDMLIRKRKLMESANKYSQQDIPTKPTELLSNDLYCCKDFVRLKIFS